ncbi:glycosyltransferase [Pelagibacterales bacterium SAG-MED49]|nr:glycosyltransferase [Pelagibacterales bacterium SAG-MED49]
MKFSKVSFLTTVFPKNEIYLNEFFNSLKNQTYKSFDIVVINDGYKNFHRIKKEYSQNLKIIELQHSRTPAKNKEYGINYCIDQNYDVIIFGDSDDYFQNNRIKKSLEFLEKTDIVINDLSLFNKRGVFKKNYISHRINNLDEVNEEFIKDKNIFGMSNTSLKLKKISKVFFDDKIIAVDWYFFQRLLKQGFKATFTNETVTYYRQHEKNSVGLSKKKNVYKLWWEK